MSEEYVRKTIGAELIPILDRALLVDKDRGGPPHEMSPWIFAAKKFLQEIQTFNRRLTQFFVLAKNRYTLGKECWFVRMTVNGIIHIHGVEDPEEMKFTRFLRDKFMCAVITADPVSPPILSGWSAIPCIEAHLHDSIEPEFMQRAIRDGFADYLTAKCGACSKRFSPVEGSFVKNRMEILVVCSDCRGNVCSRCGSRRNETSELDSIYDVCGDRVCGYCHLDTCGDCHQNKVVGEECHKCR